VKTQLNSHPEQSEASRGISKLCSYFPAYSIGFFASLGLGMMHVFWAQILVFRPFSKKCTVDRHIQREKRKILRPVSAPASP
jgi:hypothetical protein